MKSYFLLILFSVTLVCELQAQTTNNLNQDLSFNLLNTHLQNPALAGFSEKHNVQAIYAHWNPSNLSGITAPQSYSFLYDLALLKSKSLGLGVGYLNDRGGIRQSHLFNLAISYRFKFEDDHQLRIGSSFSYSNLKIIESPLPTDPFDPLLFNHTGISFYERGLSSLFGIGLNYQFKSLYVDVSTQDILAFIGGKQSYGNSEIIKTVQFNTKVGYVFSLSDFDIRTDLTYAYRYKNHFQPAVYVNYKKNYCVGISSLNFQTIELFLGFKLYDRISIGGSLGTSSDSFIRQFGFLTQAQVQLKYQFLK